MHPAEDTARVSCLMLRIQNLCQENLLRTIKSIKIRSYLYHEKPVRRSVSCWNFHFVASSPFRELPVPC